MGIPYILQSKATGCSLGSYAWSPPRYQVSGLQHRRPPMGISDENRGKVMSQLGAFMSELSTHQFDRIGSLFQDGDASYAVGECLSPSLTWQERDSLELDRGPFITEHDYLVSLISMLKTFRSRLTPFSRQFLTCWIMKVYQVIRKHRGGGTALWQSAKRLNTVKISSSTALQGNFCLR
jgi:hypothetical protein